MFNIDPHILIELEPFKKVIWLIYKKTNIFQTLVPPPQTNNPRYANMKAINELIYGANMLCFFRPLKNNRDQPETPYPLGTLGGIKICIINYETISSSIGDRHLRILCMCCVFLAYDLVAKRYTYKTLISTVVME